MDLKQLQQDIDSMALYLLREVSKLVHYNLQDCVLHLGLAFNQLFKAVQGVFPVELQVIVGHWLEDIEDEVPVDLLNTVLVVGFKKIFVFNLGLVLADDDWVFAERLELLVIYEQVVDK